MKKFEKQLKALANARRLTIIKYLKDKREANVSDIADHLKLSFKSTSKHLAVLFAAEILEKEQRSLSTFYSLSLSLPKVAKTMVRLL